MIRIILVLSLVALNQIVAQDTWVNYTNNVGVHSYAETENGLWTASTGGLCFYDSLSMEATYYNRGNSDIPSNTVYTVVEDVDKTIWFSTPRGIYTVEGDDFVQAGSGLKGGLGVTHDDKVMITADDGIYIHVADQEFTYTPYPENAGFPGVRIDTEGVLYYVYANHCYTSEAFVARYTNAAWDTIFYKSGNALSFRLDPQNDPWIINERKLQVYRSEIWTTVVELEEGYDKLYKVTADDDIIIQHNDKDKPYLKWDGVELTDTEVEEYPLSIVGLTQSPIAHNYVLRSMHPDDGKHIIVTNKIQVIEDDKWDFIDMPTTATLIRGDMRLDVDDRIWTHDEEQLWVYENGQWDSIPTPEKVSTIELLETGPDNEIWIQYSTDFAKYHNGVWEYYRPFRHGFNTYTVKDMKIDPSNGDLWFATFKGLGQFDGSEWTNYDLGNSTYPQSIAIGNDEVFVNGSSLHIIKDGVVESTGFPNDGNFEQRIISMHFDSLSEKLYVTGSDVMAYLKDEEWTVYTLENSHMHNGYSNHITTDLKGKVWISGAQGGLSVFTGDGVAVSTNDAPVSLENGDLQIVPTLVGNDSFDLIPGFSGEYDLILSTMSGEILFSRKIQLTKGDRTAVRPGLNLKGACLVTLVNRSHRITKKIIFT